MVDQCIWFYQMLICTHQCMLSLGLWQQFRSSLIFLSSKLVTEEVSARGSLEQHSILQSHKKCKFLKFAICQVITYFCSFNETIEIGMIPNIGRPIVSNLVDRFRWQFRYLSIHIIVQFISFLVHYVMGRSKEQHDSSGFSSSRYGCCCRNAVLKGRV